MVLQGMCIRKIASQAHFESRFHSGVDVFELRWLLRENYSNSGIEVITIDMAAPKNIRMTFHSSDFIKALQEFLSSCEPEQITSSHRSLSFVTVYESRVMDLRCLKLHFKIWWDLLECQRATSQLSIQ